MKMHPPTLLIVEDDDAVRASIARIFRHETYEILEAESCEAAVSIVQETLPDATICDYNLPDGDALDVLREIRAIDPLSAVIVLTGHGTIDRAVAAIQEGAEHFLTKPPNVAALRELVERMIERRRLERKYQAMSAPQMSAEADPFVGEGLSIRTLAQEAEKIANSDSTVLIYGETGAGKGVLARWLHAHSPRADGPLVEVNCAGLGGDLLESELFGHEKGAFTGAVSRKQGLLEVAHGGTLFLDEIGDMDIKVQAKLLKVLEERRYRRVGETTDRAVDIRLLTATHRDLKELVREGSFREDLYFRIHTIPLRVPPLRERPEDLPLLTEHLLARLGAEMGRAGVRLSPAALDVLQEHSWPGNIRELRNVLERAVLLSEGSTLQPHALRFEGPGPARESELKEEDEPRTLEEVERQHILQALHAADGRVARAAETLGLPRSTLYERIKRHGIDLSEI